MDIDAANPTAIKDGLWPANHGPREVWIEGVRWHNEHGEDHLLWVGADIPSSNASEGSVRYVRADLVKDMKS